MFCVTYIDLETSSWKRLKREELSGIQKKYKMSKIVISISILVLCLLIGGIHCSMKPAVTFQNSLTGINSLQDAPSSSLSQEVVDKLGEIAKILKDGYQGVSDVTIEHF